MSRTGCRIGPGAEYPAIGQQDARPHFTWREIAKLTVRPIRDAPEGRRRMQIYYRAPGGLPGLGGRIVNLRIGRVQYVESQERAIGQQCPSFLGVEITLSCVAEQCPRQR